MTNSATFADELVALERQYPTYETDLSIRAEIQNLPVLPNNPKLARVSELLADLDHWAGRLTPGSYSVMASNSSSATAQRNSATARKSQVAVAIALTVCE